MAFGVPRCRDLGFGTLQSYTQYRHDNTTSDGNYALSSADLLHLQVPDLTKTITIRGEPHSVIDALLRQLSHCSYHVGQIVQLSRHLAKDNWTVLTIPRGGTKKFNAMMDAKHAKK